MPSEKCTKCGKTVYVVEKLEILGQVWHKWCFKCTTCGMALNMKNYSATGGKPYCKAHYPMPVSEGTSSGALPVEPHDPSRGVTQGTDYSTGGFQEEEYAEEYQA